MAGEVAEDIAVFAAHCEFASDAGIGQRVQINGAVFNAQLASGHPSTV